MPNISETGRRRIGFIGAAAALVTTGGALVFAADRTVLAPHATPARPSPTATHKTPGGLWISPSEGEVETGPIHFEARAYPTVPHADPEVTLVEFTLSWEGRLGPWLVACKETMPIQGDIYKCDYDPKKSVEPIPNGIVHVSFDVYDQAGNANLSPNGTRDIINAQK